MKPLEGGLLLISPSGRYHSSWPAALPHPDSTMPGDHLELPLSGGVRRFHLRRVLLLSVLDSLLIVCSFNISPTYWVRPCWGEHFLGPRHWDASVPIGADAKLMVRFLLDSENCKKKPKRILQRSNRNCLCSFFLSNSNKCTMIRVMMTRHVFAGGRKLRKWI